MVDKTNGPAPIRSLHRKLAQIFYEAHRIPKNGIGPREQGSYPFVQVGDAADYIRKALAEKVITMMPTSVQVVGQSDRPTAKGGTMTTVDLLTEWTLTDGESGESITIMAFGAGADTGDKYSGKATTSAMKYALLSGFLLSTGDDTENTDTSDRRTRPPARTEPDTAAVQQTTHRDGLVGKAIAQGSQDFQLRIGPDGPVLPFRIKEGRLSQIAVATGDIARALDTFRETVLNQRITLWGHYTDEEYDKRNKDTDKLETITYKVLHVERIATPDFILPSPITDSPFTDANPDGVAPLREAESAPLFDAAESARLDAEEAAVS